MENNTTAFPNPETQSRPSNPILLTLIISLITFGLGAVLTFFIMKSIKIEEKPVAESLKVQPSPTPSEKPVEMLTYNNDMVGISFTYQSKFGTPKTTLFSCGSDEVATAKDACYFSIKFSSSDLFIEGFDDQKVNKEGGVTNTMLRFENSFLGGETQSKLKKLCSSSNVFDCTVSGASHWRLLVAPDGHFDQMTKLGGEEYGWTRLEVDYNPDRKFKVIMAHYPLENCPFELDIDAIKHVANDISKGLPMCKSKIQVEYDQTLDSIQASNTVDVR